MDIVQQMTNEALEAAIAARVPTMLVGAPGTGKTQSVKALAEKMGYKLITVIGSQMEPTDIVGLPKGEKFGKDEHGEDIFGTVYLSPHWQVEILQKKKVILFLDEFSNTSGATRASMLNMLQDREFPNGKRMPAETIVIGAMNPTDQAADGYELDLPTTNRIFFMSWKPTAESWYQGMLKAWGKEVSEKEMYWRKMIVKFVRENPGRMHSEPVEAGNTDSYGVNMQDPSEAEVFRYAWSSRRSWDNLARVLGHAGSDHSVQDVIAHGLVGAASATEFRDFLAKAETYDPKEVLNDPESVDWESLSVNDMTLILRSISASAEKDEENQNLEHILKVTKVFKMVADKGRAAGGAAYIQSVLKAAGKIGRGLSDQKARAMLMDETKSLMGSYRDVARASSARK